MRKNIFLTAGVLFVLIQFLRPKQDIGELTTINTFLKETKPSKEVQNILKTSCYDCHSNATAYPWYNHITPINYYLNRHVNHGKEHFNISSWESYNTHKKAHILEEIIETIENETMPLTSYKIIHQDSKITKEEATSLIQWAKLTWLDYNSKINPKGIFE